MGDQLGGAERRLSITQRRTGVVSACVLLACVFAPGAFADGLKPDPSPAAGGLGPDSAATPTRAPVQRTTPKPVVRATHSTPVAPVVTRTVVVPVPAAPAPAAVTRVAPKPAQPKAKPARAAKPKPKPRASRPHRVLPLGVRAAVAGANTTVSAAQLALPAALAFVALVAASSGFLSLVVRLRRELAP
jgi:hypothetical protein